MLGVCRIVVDDLGLVAARDDAGPDAAAMLPAPTMVTFIFVSS